MFAGKFTTTLDDKSRITVPAKFRMFLRTPHDKGGFFVMVAGDSGARCLCLYPYSSYEKIVERAKRDTGDTNHPVRDLATLSEFAALDKQGRMVLPREMVAQASLAGEVLLVGMIHWIEAWNPDAWQSAARAAGAPARDFRRYLELPDTP